MRTRTILVALTLVAACGGVEGPVLYPSPDGAVGGSPSGTAGGALGTGGAVGTGGHATGTGGAIIGMGGAVLGTGGSALGRGGASGTGGRAVGTGGTLLGAGGSALGRGGANLGTGGGAGAGGGAGGNNADAGVPCSSRTTLDDCRDAGCQPVNGFANNGASAVSTFLGCREPIVCPPVVTAAYPPGEPNQCYVFYDGCIPTGWTASPGGSECPAPTITALKMGLNCMPGPPSDMDRLVGSFDVTYDNTDGATATQAVVKSASLSYTDTVWHSISFAVIPPESGIVPAGERVVINHRKDPESPSGLGCVCDPPLSVILTVSWDIDGKLVTSGFGPTTLECSY